MRRAWQYRLHGDKFGLAFLLSRELTGATVVDIGANRGIYSYWMHQKVGDKGTVVAFEPQPELNAGLSRLRAAFKLNRLEIAGLGLSSTEADKHLVRPREHWGGASFEKAPNAGTEVLNVHVTTLDAYFQSHPGRPIRFIKCDVEDHEFDVLQGSRQILEKDRPDLLVECRPDHPQNKTVPLLASLGYAGFCFYGRGYAPISKYNELRSSLHRKALLNFAFVPEENAQTLTPMTG